MKQKLIKKMVSEKESELIDVMRNYVKSYPNGYPQLLNYAQELFDELINVHAH